MFFSLTVFLVENAANILKMATHNSSDKTVHRCNNKINYFNRPRIILFNQPEFDKSVNVVITEQPIKGFKRKKMFITVNRISWFCTIVIVLLPIVVGQYTTRDPRFYSREGDFNYKWPNPGDPDYR